MNSAQLNKKCDQESVVLEVILNKYCFRAFCCMSSTLSPVFPVSLSCHYLNKADTRKNNNQKKKKKNQTPESSYLITRTKQTHLSSEISLIKQVRDPFAKKKESEPISLKNKAFISLILVAP